MVKQKIKQKDKYSNEVQLGVNYFKVVVILIAVFSIFYFITYVVTKKSKQPEQTTSIQYKEIIIGNILNIKQDEYYVLVEFESDKYNNLYETYLINYSQTENSKPYYTVDMSNGFNKQYISDTSNLDAQTVSEIKFSSTTLLKIKSGKIIEKHTTNETIITALQAL